ncbi:MAG: hypothetical protein R3C59_27065 [Planctomycetaceae bacterium]
MSTTDSTLIEFAEYLTDGFAPDVAAHFAGLPEPNPKLQGLLHTLAEKANQGTLTESERRQYERLVDLTDFVTLLRLKARVKAQSRTAG